MDPRGLKASLMTWSLDWRSPREHPWSTNSTRRIVGRLVVQISHGGWHLQSMKPKVLSKEFSIYDYPCIYLSIYLSNYLSIYIYIYISISINMYIYIYYIYLYIYTYIYNYIYVCVIPQSILPRISPSSLCAERQDLKPLPTSLAVEPLKFGRYLGDAVPRFLGSRVMNCAHIIYHVYYIYI